MKYRNLKLCMLFLIVSQLPAAGIFVVDPYQYFHRSYFTPNYFIKRQGRMQNAGVIKNYIEANDEFDTIVAGASLSANYDSELVPKIFHSKKNSINLSIAGAFVSEQIVVVENALRTEKIKNVFWSIATHWYRDKEQLHPTVAFPSYLYNSDTLDDFNYLYDFQSLVASAGYLATFLKKPPSDKTLKKLSIPSYTMLPLEQHGSWSPWNEVEMEELKSGKFSERYKKAILKRTMNTDHLLENGKLKLPTFASLPAGSFDTEINVLSYFFNKHPDVKFVLVVPPVSVFYYHSISQKELETALYRPIILAGLAEKFSNVKLYGFNDDFIINDPRNYRDIGHFDLNISRFIIREIAKNNNEITTSNAEDFVSVLKKSITQLDRQEPFLIPTYPRTIDFSGNRHIK